MPRQEEAESHTPQEKAWAKNETVVQGCHSAAALQGECDESAGVASGRTSVFNAQLRIQNGV
ncbi:MAG: hypothetical protein J6X98_03305 [Bacteroidales bacterium]|nr:hypothetical protein [Bacteroidales bacterium]